MCAKKRIKYEEIFENEISKENNSEMQEAFNSNAPAEIDPQQVVKGKVTSVSRDEITVDIGFKSEGRIPCEEFFSSDPNFNIKVGDEIDVFVESLNPGSGGLRLSRAKALMLNAWERIESAYNSGGLVQAKVTGVTRGGLNASIDGVPAFMPASQSGGDYSNLDEMLGQIFDVKVIEFKGERKDVVVSRKAASEEERLKKRSLLLPQLKEGTVFTGRVKNIMDYGIFVDIGGMDGFVHVGDLSWARIKSPKELVTPGQELHVMVLSYDREKEKLSLGVKQTQRNPWEDVASKYRPGEKIKGKVVSLTDYGAFVEMEPGVEGMIHVSELSWTGKIKKPSQLLKTGDVVEAVVLEVDKAKQRVALGLKQVGPNPWDDLKNKYPEGTRVKGSIKNITDFGIFVNIGEEFDGLIKIGDISWDQKEKEPLKGYAVGQNIEAVVIDVDVLRQRLSLGVKQLSEDPWKDINKRYPNGRIVDGKVTRTADFGVFVELEPGIEGLIHISEISEEKIKKIGHEMFKPGQTVSSLIKNIDLKNRKISLSIKEAKKKEERDNVENFVKKQGDVKLSLGDLIKNKLKEGK